MRPLLVILFLLLLRPCHAMTEPEALAIIVTDLQVSLQESDRWRGWDRRWYGYWKIYDLWPHTGFWKTQ